MDVLGTHAHFVRCTLSRRRHFAREMKKKYLKAFNGAAKTSEIALNECFLPMATQ
jgi:hypothetical protein